MNALDVDSDTVFREHAIRAIEELLKDHPIGDNPKIPLKRSQVSGLKQIANNQPEKVLDFAKHQKEKLEKKRADLGKKFEGSKDEPIINHQVNFWDLVIRLCGEEAKATGWSLHHLAEVRAPVDCRPGDKPRPNDPVGERDAWKQRKKRAEEWHDTRRAEFYPAFFQRFCVHYIFATIQGRQAQES